MKPRYTIYEIFEQAEEDRNLLAEVEKTQAELKDVLEKHDFQVTEPLFLDGAQHVQQKGESYEWSYTASYSNANNLHCSAGFTHRSQQIDIKIHIVHIKKKKKGK